MSLGAAYLSGFIINKERAIESMKEEVEMLQNRIAFENARIENLQHEIQELRDALAKLEKQ